MSVVLSRTEQLAGLTGNISRIFIASQSKISLAIAGTLLALSAWFAGQLVWILGSDNAATSQWTAQSASGFTSSSSAELDVSELLDAALFGTYNTQPEKVPVAPVVQDAPKTQLNLVLVGAVSSSIAEKGLAVISNNSSQTTYGVGEKIEGTNAKLKSVFIDRVIIDNAGRIETLMLEGIDYNRTALPAERKPSNESRQNNIGNNPSPAIDVADLDEIRGEILADPQKILQYIRLSQVKKDGNLVGYRIRPGKQRALFDSAGLQNGDIATSLNGEDLTDPSSMGKIWQSMTEMTEFNLTVERDGQSHDIYIEF